MKPVPETARSSPAVTPTLPANLPPQAPPQGFLALTTDLPCIVTLDGTEIGRLRRDSGDTFLVAPGPHLLAAIETDSGRSWARLIEVYAGHRAEASIRFVTAMEEEAQGFRPVWPELEFVRVPPGEFRMGSDRSLPHEGPPRRVRITRPFEIGLTPVTQREWILVMRRNPSPWELADEAKPVVNVSWEDTQEFLRRLNEIEPSHIYRLPTEAEWEYACRAGNPRDVVPRDMEGRARPGSLIHPDGLRRVDRNPWGIQAIRGTVSEWCQDWYEPDAYARSPEVDPQGPAEGSRKVFRGGPFATNGEGFRPAERASYETTVRTVHIGFRVVRVPRESGF